MKIIVNGAGAAGLSIVQQLIRLGSKHIIIVDTQGAIYKGRKENMNSFKNSLAEITNENLIQGKLEELL